MSDSQIEEGQQISDHEQSSQFIKVKHAGRKNLCEICNNLLAKYTCPKCQIKTCSLNCTKKHKSIKQCSGERDPTQYVSKQQINQKIVEKDYNFIEQMISGADKVKKVLTGVNNTINLQPRRFKILRNNAKLLYGIRLLNGPNILQRHRQNISFFFVKNKSIYWVFQLLYFVGNTNKSTNTEFSDRLQKTNHQKGYERELQTQKITTQPISDQKLFCQILPQNYLNKILLQNRNINTTKRQEFNVFLQNKQKSFSQQSPLHQYKRDNISNQDSNYPKNVVLSNKKISGKFSVNYELIQYQADKTIAQQMRNISVFQFPSLYVVHQSMRQQFLRSYASTKFSAQTKSLQKSKDKKLRQPKSRQQEQRERSRQKEHNKKTNKINQGC